MIAVDTNVIVRLLVADDRRQANRARRLFEGHSAERFATFDRELLTAARRLSGLISVVEP